MSNRCAGSVRRAAIISNVDTPARMSMLRYNERKVTNKKYKTVFIKTYNVDNFVGRMEDFLESNDISLKKLEINDSPNRGEDGRLWSVVCLTLKYPKYADSTYLISEMAKIEGVKEVHTE